MLRVVVSTSAAARLDAARQFLSQFPPATETVVVAATRGAADDFARELALRAPATFGVSRFSFTELAARAASMHRAGQRAAPATQPGAEAVAARAVFDAMAAGELEYFSPVASMPGFSKALARTIHELRLAGVDRDRLLGQGAASADVGRLLARVEIEYSRAAVDDRAALFRLAAPGVAAVHRTLDGNPTVPPGCRRQLASSRDFNYRVHR